MSVSIGLLRPVTTDASLCRKVAAHETLLQEGVIKLVEGVTIRLNTRYQLVVTIKVLADFGADFVRMANKVQEAVHRGLTNVTNLQVAAIHVRIVGVKVTSGSAPQRTESVKETVS